MEAGVDPRRSIHKLVARASEEASVPLTDVAARRVEGDIVPVDESQGGEAANGPLPDLGSGWQVYERGLALQCDSSRFLDPEDQQAIEKMDALHGTFDESHKPFGGDTDSPSGVTLPL